ASEQVLRRRDVRLDDYLRHVCQRPRIVGVRSASRRRRRQRIGLGDARRLLALGPHGSDHRRRARQPDRTDVRRRKLPVPAAADRTRAELRALDGLWHFRVRERLPVVAMMNHYLSIILFLPLAGALLLLVVDRQNVNAIRWIANIVALAGFVVSIPLWFKYNPQNPEFQLVERAQWIPSIGAEYHLVV